MTKSKGCSVKTLVRPAVSLLLAMGQFGPCLEPSGWIRTIDCLLRAAIAFPLILWALHDLRSSVKKEGEG